MPLSPQDEKVIAVAGESLYKMALGDGHRSLGCCYSEEKIDENSTREDGQCLVGYVMLAVELIESMGNHLMGTTNHTAEAGVSKFSELYFKKIENKYVTKDLWRVRRNEHLHNYATSIIGQLAQMLFDMR